MGSRIGNLQTVGSARVNAAQDAYVANNGAFAGAPTDNGAGDSTLTIDTDYPPLAGGIGPNDIVTAQTEAGADGNCTVERLSATQIQVRSFVGGAATDLAYSVEITKQLIG